MLKLLFQFQSNYSNFRWLVILFALLAVSPVAWSASYYVDASGGSDSNLGTQSLPWRSVSKVNNASLAAGDTVYFMRGRTWAEGLVPRSGISGNPITYDAYGSGAKPVIDNCNISSKSYIKVANLSFVASNTFQRSPINLSSSHDITIQSCDAIMGSSTANVWASLNVVNSNYNRILNTLIERRNTGNQGDAAYFEYSNHNLFEGNTITIATHYALGVYSSSYNIFRQNKISNTQGGLMESIAVVGSNVGSDHNLIEMNTISGGGPSTFCASTMGIAVHNRYSIVRGNLIRDNPQTGERGKGIAVNGYSTNTNYGNRIYNNIVTRYTNMGVNMETADGQTVSNVIFKNNVFFGNDTNKQAVIKETGVSDYHFLNNVFFNSGQSTVIYVSGNYWSTDQAAAGRSSYFAGNIQKDPLLDSNYEPLSGSPCIDSGAFLTTVTSASGSGTVFTVADPLYFSDGFGIGTGDTIKVGNVTAAIKSINYDTKQITLAQAISWTNGSPVSLAYSGTRPDIGIYEAGFQNVLYPPTNVRIIN